MKVGRRKVKIFRFGLEKWFCPRIFARFAEAGKNQSKTAAREECNDCYFLFLIDEL
jgi:hypothetical protein